MSKSNRTKNTVIQPNVLVTIDKIVGICREDGPSEGTFKRVLTELKRLIAFDAATIYLCDLSTGQLQQAASVNGPVAILEFLTIEHGEGLAGWAADAGKPVLLADRSGHHDFDPDNDFASFMSVPLVQGKRTTGVINLGSRTAGAFGEADVQLMSLVANQVALSLENLRYEKELADLKTSLDELQAQFRQSQADSKPAIEPSEIKDFVARVNHDVNNALAILLGNIQCMLMDNSVTDQNTVSRLRRMERALMKINDANHRLLELVKITAHQECLKAERGSKNTKVLAKNV